MIELLEGLLRGGAEKRKKIPPDSLPQNFTVPEAKGVGPENIVNQIGILAINVGNTLEGKGIRVRPEVEKKEAWEIEGGNYHVHYQGTDGGKNLEATVMMSPEGKLKGITVIKSQKRAPTDVFIITTSSFERGYCHAKVEDDAVKLETIEGTSYYTPDKIIGVRRMVTTLSPRRGKAPVRYVQMEGEYRAIGPNSMVLVEGLRVSFGNTLVPAEEFSGIPGGVGRKIGALPEGSPSVLYKSEGNQYKWEEGGTLKGKSVIQSGVALPREFEAGGHIYFRPEAYPRSYPGEEFTGSRYLGSMWVNVRSLISDAVPSNVF